MYFDFWVRDQVSKLQKYNFKWISKLFICDCHLEVPQVANYIISVFLMCLFHGKQWISLLSSAKLNQMPAETAEAHLSCQIQ